VDLEQSTADLEQPTVEPEQPTVLAWQHVFEERYRNKYSTTTGVADIWSKEFNGIKPGKQKEEEHDRKY
jgi:hypothetical protein